MKHRSKLAVVVALLLVGAAAGALQSSSTTPVTQNTDGVVLSEPGGPSITLLGDTDIANTSGGSGDSIQFHTSDGDIEFTAAKSASAELNVSNITGATTTVEAISTPDTELVIDAGDKRAVRAGGDIDHLTIHDNITLDDGNIDFEYGGPFGSNSLVGVDGYSPGEWVVAVDADTGSKLDVGRVDNNGWLRFQALPNSDHTVQLQSLGEYVVGSQHTTDSDFTSASTLSHVTVTGSGDSATVDYASSETYADQFEDGSLSEYTAYDTISGSGLSTDHVLNGSNSLEVRSDDKGVKTANYLNNASRYLSDSGLSIYPSDGDIATLNVYQETNAAVPVVYLGVDESQDDMTGYAVLLNYVGDAELYRLDSGDSFTQLDTSGTGVYDSDGWTDVTINTSGTGFSIEYKGSTQLSTTDESYLTSDMGVGLGAASQSGNESTWYDDFSVEPSRQGTYVSDTHGVDGGEIAAINITDATNASAELAVEYYDGNTWQTGVSTTISNAANHTLSLPDVSSSQWRVRADITKTGADATLSLADDAILFTNHDPIAGAVSPSDGAKLTSSTVNFSVGVSDPEFPTAQGDAVDARLYIDGQQVDSKTVTSNQTVTISRNLSQGGDRDYYWVLEDSYGATDTTGTRTVFVPSELTIRDVTNTTQLVDGDNVTVTFYGDDLGIVERDADNGTVSLDGLNVDQQFTVIVRADDYYQRQTIIPSLYAQSNIWLLPKNDTDAVEIVFQLDDRTGKFANSDDTQLRVQRAIEHNNTTEWRDVVGDDISATAELATILENQQRYRLIVSNDVESRILGSYSPSGPADPEIIPIGRIDFQGDSDSGTAFDASVINETRPGIRFTYRDPDQNADSLKYRILNVTDEDNTTVLVGNTSIVSPEEFTTVTEALPANETLDGSTYRVQLWAYQNGDVVDERSAYVGKITGPGDWTTGVNESVLNLAGFVLLVGAGYGTANYNPRLGVLVAVVMGATLTMFNVVDIAPVVLGFTGTIALIANAADKT